MQITRNRGQRSEIREQGSGVRDLTPCKATKGGKYDALQGYKRRHRISFREKLAPQVFKSGEGDDLEVSKP
jgi:hypothetical protein